ncbi:hypothetical protein, partial [Bacteroides mediterraneensis]|uniref:hypothetical protein n=1 Tax=Bacteroides mediterraneensis TaxID=1841856 RepID=UPI00195F1C78
IKYDLSRKEIAFIEKMIKIMQKLFNIYGDIYFTIIKNNSKKIPFIKLYYYNTKKESYHFS